MLIYENFFIYLFYLKYIFYPVDLNGFINMSRHLFYNSQSKKKMFHLIH